MRAVAVMLLALVLALPASAAPLTRPLPQTKAMPLATDIGPVKLTDSECTNLGGAVRSTMTKECSSGTAEAVAANGEADSAGEPNWDFQTA